MKTKKLVGLIIAGVGGYMLWKKRQVAKVALVNATTTAANAPLTAAEEEQFSPLVFKRGEGCPR